MKSAGKLAVGLALLALILAVVVWFGWRSSNSGASGQTTNSGSKALPKPLTAGGLPVPPAFQARAKNLGYYCPSWAAKPGSPVSTACPALDR